MKRNTYLFLVGAPIVAIILVAIRIYYSAVVWKYSGPDVTFLIRPNENFSSINSRLAKQKLISSARLFHRYSQYKGVLNKFRAGRYIIKQDSNLLKVFDTFINEKSLTALFTIPEGKNLYEIGKMLEEKGVTNYVEFINLARDPVFAAQLGIKGTSVEGYLYPDTYDFYSELPAEQVIRIMVNQFKKKTKDIDFKVQKFGPYKLTKEEVITMASIVEKETGDKAERPLIAGVFHNRLKKRMRLQSDPTTIYGMYERYTGNIKRSDLLEPTPYNTYTIKALPIGPISNPGIESIKAVLEPASHNFLYFVSQNDGTHIFSETYESHQTAVNKWQRNAKNREGRSWRNKRDDSSAQNAPAQ